MTERQYLQEGLGLVRMLEAHHGIEETDLFPKLALKMPEFQSLLNTGENHEMDGKDDIVPSNDKTSTHDNRTGILVSQHAAIYKGMNEFGTYLRSCYDGSESLNFESLQQQMDTWGNVLWDHLQLEVQVLEAENMRKFWTIEEMEEIEF